LLDFFSRASVIWFGFFWLTITFTGIHLIGLQIFKKKNESVVNVIPLQVLNNPDADQQQNQDDDDAPRINNTHYCLVSLMWMKIGSNDITAQVPGVS
jgi:hypothetical protein